MKEKLKILQVVTLSEIGGAQKVLYNIVRGLNHRDNLCFEAVCAPDGELVGWLRELGVRVFELPELVRNISPEKDLKALCKLYRLMVEGKYDIVHCHSSKAGILGRFAAKMAGVPRIIFTVHGWGVNPEQPWYKRSLFGLAEKSAGLVSTDVVCVSQADFEMGKKFVHTGKLSVILNGVERPGSRTGKLRREIGVKSGELVVGMVARLKAPKDPIFFLRTAGHLIEEGFNNIQFVVLGDGPLMGDCARFVREQGLTGRVHFLGTRADVGELYADFDIFTLFSAWEGLPLSICEGMLAGLPVVASDVGGVKEQVTNEWNGYLLEQHDVGKAAEFLKKMILDESLRQKMSEHSRERGEELFLMDRMVKGYRRLYLGEPI